MLTGTAGIDEFLAHAATLDDFATDTVMLRDAEVLQTLFEIRVAGRQASLPPGLHPTNPPTFVAQVWQCPDSPWGAFRLVQGRVGSRSGLRPRGFAQGAVCDNPDAADALRRRWGFPVQLGTVHLQRRYDAIAARATLGEMTVFELVADDAEPLGEHDVSYSTAVALAHTPSGLRLVQIDIDFVVSRAERLRPRLDTFVAGPWMHPMVVPYHAVSASFAIGDLTLERLRYVSKPDELAFSGTESVGA